MIDLNTSWAEKYRPKDISELILPNSQWKLLVEEWIEKKFIGGNIALFGFGGLGKSSLAKLLVKNIIQSSADFKLIKSRSVQEIDTIGEFIRSKPIASPIKIILIEEADRLSSVAQTELKDKYTEQYQDTCSIIITTNYPHLIDEFLLQRFLYKIDFSRLDQNAVFQRLMYILNQEECKVNENDLKEWIEKNIHYGMRNLINQLQICSFLNNKIIIFDDVTEKKDLETKIINLIQVILSNLLSCKDIKLKKMAFINPVNSSIIGPQWVELVQTLTNNYGLDYQNIFETIEKNIHFLPIKQIIYTYMDTLKHKQYPHLHVIACMADIIKCINEVAM